MKRTIGFIIILAAMAFTLVSWKSSYVEYSVITRDELMKSKMLFKGLKDAVDFTKDDKDNYYVAFKDRIQYIDDMGKSYNVLTNKDLNISSLDHSNGVLYYASATKVFSYNIETKENKEIIKNLPNYGDYKKSLIRVNEEYLFVTIGAATNSGVVGQDNLWLDAYPEAHDITPRTITIKGVNFGTEKTGAFVSYKTKNIKGQIVIEHSLGNSSMIIYNLKTGAVETFAWGIRNMKGIDFNSEGKAIVTVGGMEDRGLRPVKGDSDYIYQIKKNTWYGFPDYSGGDEISSSTFKGINNQAISFVLEQHPTTNPPLPIYKHKSVNSLVSLAIDKKGVIGDKDCIYFYERNDNNIYSLDKTNLIKEKINFQEDSYISSMKFFDNLIALDSNGGFLISIEKDNVEVTMGTQKINCYLLVIVITLIVSILVYLRRKI